MKTHGGRFEQAWLWFANWSNTPWTYPRWKFISPSVVWRRIYNAPREANVARYCLAGPGHSRYDIRFTGWRLIAVASNKFQASVEECHNKCRRWTTPKAVAAINISQIKKTYTESSLHFSRQLASKSADSIYWKHISQAIKHKFVLVCTHTYFRATVSAKIPAGKLLILLSSSLLTRRQETPASKGGVGRTGSNTRNKP